jgi:hypothetical protein
VAAIPVYLEIGGRRVFASALDWPGWSRSGRDEESALQALVDAGPRYRRALGRSGTGFVPPGAVSALRVVERVPGNATTDFGAPGLEATSDGRPLTAAEAERLSALLRACWAAFDASAEAAVGAVLQKGPRGGGRELGAIVEHVLDADLAYLRGFGGLAPKGDDAARMAAMRTAFLDTVALLARGEPPPRTPRSGRLWAPRYAVRRSAWHAIDHAWEIEDRAEPPGRGAP